jgi:hypothetical protein
MSFYSDSLYAPEVEYSETSGTRAHGGEEQSIEWRPKQWILRAAATAAVCTLLTSPMSSSTPIVTRGVAGHGHERTGQSSTDAASRISRVDLRLMTERMRERAGFAARLFQRTPHPGADEPDPDYGL